MGVVLATQVAVREDPPSTEKVTVPVGAVPVPVHASETLSAEAFGYVTVVTALSVKVGACKLTLKLLGVAEAAA
jgi:hypothetical protein